MTVELTHIVLAATNLDACAAFYRDALGAELAASDMGGISFYDGTLAGFQLRLFPADVVGIDATSNRHQLGFSVSDIAAVIKAGVAAGGSLDDGWEIQDAGDHLLGAIRDPDGNSIELKQQAR